MTEKKQAHFSHEGSSEDAPGGADMKIDHERDREILGLKRGLHDQPRDLDSFKPNHAAKQTIDDSIDLAISPVARDESRDNFERLLREGSKSSRAKGAGQKNGCIPLLLIFSFFLSLVFPLFWIVFILIILGVLIYAGREWMG